MHSTCDIIQFGPGQQTFIWNGISNCGQFVLALNCKAIRGSHIYVDTAEGERGVLQRERNYVASKLISFVNFRQMKFTQIFNSARGCFSLAIVLAAFQLNLDYIWDIYDIDINSYWLRFIPSLWALVRRLLIAWKMNESEVKVLDRRRVPYTGCQFRLGDYSSSLRFDSRVESMAKFVISYLH